MGGFAPIVKILIISRKQIFLFKTKVVNLGCCKSKERSRNAINDSGGTLTGRNDVRNVEQRSSTPNEYVIQSFKSNFTVKKYSTLQLHHHNNNSNKMLSPSGIFPAPNSQQRISTNDNDQKNRRSKVALKPGRSLMDWIRLANSGKDIQGYSGRNLEITTSELAKHNTIDNCWMAIRGIVPYTAFAWKILA